VLLADNKADSTTPRQNHTKIDLSRVDDVRYRTALIGYTKEPLREAARKASCSELDKVREQITPA
jgi:hypothetical protein